MKKEIFLKKLDLLSISLEVLTSWNENKQIVRRFDYLYYDIKNKNYNKKQRFIFLVKYIYNILKIIKKYSLIKLANKIVSNNKQSLKKYISKFCYTYYKNKKYYVNHKLVLYNYNKIEQIAINDNAILNLYIICQLKKNYGIYTLIKYLEK
uniref:Uncharacterized protein n=1 Tax=Leptosiphonia brodiei TaxID=2608611 RepID=A0A1Z1MAR1_9FLOR|nr:hypothetical protein [Leptosiphonia brodiei]ARW63003.1 hypothetical protein [Leptosiphonia brodiei]